MNGFRIVPVSCYRLVSVIYYQLVLPDHYPPSLRRTPLTPLTARSLGRPPWRRAPGRRPQPPPPHAALRRPTECWRRRSPPRLGTERGRRSVAGRVRRPR